MTNLENLVERANEISRAWSNTIVLGDFKDYKEFYGIQNVDEILVLFIEMKNALSLQLSDKQSSKNYDYDAAMWEIGEIVRVVRDKPAASLVDFMKANFPAEWGLTREEHKEYLSSNPPTLQEEK